MYTIENEVLTLEEASKRLGPPGLLAECREEAKRVGPMTLLCPIRWPTALAKERPGLIAWVPDLTEKELRELAACELDVYNEQSADLRRVYMYRSLRSSTREIRVDDWALWYGIHPDEDGIFYVVLVAESSVAVCIHHQSAKYAEDYGEYLRVHGMSSGDNYRPHREYSQAELEAAAGKADDAEPHVVTLNVYTLRSTLKGDAEERDASARSPKKR